MKYLIDFLKNCFLGIAIVVVLLTFFFAGVWGGQSHGSTYVEAFPTPDTSGCVCWDDSVSVSVGEIVTNVDGQDEYRLTLRDHEYGDVLHLEYLYMGLAWVEAE